MLFVAVTALTGCRNNTKIQLPAIRNYVQDAEILNQYVETNDATHEFYINPDKKTSTRAYIEGQSEELNQVNSNNLHLFKQSMARVNAYATQMAANRSVDYIVMITEREIHINRIKPDSPITLVKQLSGIRYQARIKALLNLENQVQTYDVYGKPSVWTVIDLNPNTYNHAGWAFLVTCKTGNRYDLREAKVLVCGIGYPYNSCLQWNCTASYGHDTEWNFTTQSFNDAPIGQLSFIE